MGFIVIRDFVKREDEKGAVGISSAKPANLLQMHIGVDPDDNIYEYNGGKIKVRLRDADNNVYYHCYVDDADFSAELALTWSGSYAGACDLDLHMDDYKRLYGEPKYESYISQDGKWYHYMG